MTPSEQQRLAQLKTDYKLTSDIAQLHEALCLVRDAQTLDTRVIDLTVGERADVEWRVFERLVAMTSRSAGTNVARSFSRNPPELVRRETLLALQEVLQESAFKRSFELLSAVRAEFQGVIKQIDSAFAALENTGKQLQLAALVGKKKPPRSNSPLPEDKHARLSRLTQLITANGLAVSARTAADIEDGVVRILSERFPGSLRSDFQPVVEAARDRAIKLLEENGGNWPKTKGSWYPRLIDELLIERADLFDPVLARN